MALRLGDGVERLPGIGPARARSLEKLGLATVEDLLRYFPRDYEDRRQVHHRGGPPCGQPVCVAAMAAEHPRKARIRKGLELVQVKVVDHTGALHLTFFNQGYVEKALRAGEEYIFFGTVEEQGRRRSMVNPIFERADRQSFTGCIMPVYRLTAGISNHLLASLTRQALRGGLRRACPRDPAPAGPPGAPPGRRRVRPAQYPLPRRRGGPGAGPAAAHL